MPGGRPTLYKFEYAEVARNACMVGATNQTLAERFGVSRQTVDNWIASIPDFSDAVRKGRHVADEAVVAALFARATGMARTVTRVFCHEGKPVSASYSETLPPDVRACIFWLRNRQPQHWNEGRLQAEEKDGWDWSELEKPRMRASLPPPRKSSDADAAAASAAERLHVHL